jgi:hypothetical protein
LWFVCGLLFSGLTKFVSSRDILKIKVFQDAEYVVKGIRTAPMPFQIDGKIVVQEVLSAIVIDHKGFIFIFIFIFLPPNFLY